jgi:hypothetical protein
MQLMVGVARQIWLRRNAVVFRGEFLSPGALVKQASDQLEAWRKVEIGRRFGNSSCSRPLNTSWQRPPEGMIKFNWDTAINKVTRRMGVGIIARDAVLEYKDTYCHGPDAYAAYCLVRPAQLLCLHAAAPDKPTYLLPCQSKPADRPTQISKQNPRLSHCLSKLVFCLVTNSIKSVALM